MWCSMQLKLPNTKLFKTPKLKYILYSILKFPRKKNSLLNSKTDHCNTDLILIITHDMLKYLYDILKNNTKSV